MGLGEGKSLNSTIDDVECSSMPQIGPALV